MEQHNPDKIDTGRSIRNSSIKIWRDDAKCKIISESVSRDTAKLWNNAPPAITTAYTLSRAKSEIKKFCRSLEQ